DLRSTLPFLLRCLPQAHTFTDVSHPLNCHSDASPHRVGPGAVINIVPLRNTQLDQPLGARAILLQQLVGGRLRVKGYGCHRHLGQPAMMERQYFIESAGVLGPEVQTAQVWFSSIGKCDDQAVARKLRNQSESSQPSVHNYGKYLSV